MKNIEKKVKNELFSKACDDWLYFKQISVKESSYLNYKFKIDKHLKPDLGKKTLGELLQYDINKYIKDKKSKIDTSSLRDIVIVLKSILRYLNKRYKLDFDLDFSFGPRDYLDEIEVFNEYERMKLSRYLLASEKIKDLGLLISLYSGLRIGEVCGLKWKDIDLDNKVINVKRTVQRVYLGKNQTKVIITTPKTRRSARKIPISRHLIQTLNKYSKEFPQDAFVLTRKN